MINSKNKISFFTSFDVKNQGNEYKSWRRYAHKIYAVQDLKEKLENECSLIFSKSTKIENKYLHKLFDVVKIARLFEGNEKFVIANSDIELNFSSQYWNEILEISNDKIVAGHRFEYTNNRNQGKKNEYNIDFFIINKIIKFTDVPIFIGYWGWDWWIVYLCMAQKIPIHMVETENNIFYKVSNLQKQKPEDIKEKIRKRLMEYIQNV